MTNLCDRCLVQIETSWCWHKTADLCGDCARDTCAACKADLFEEHYADDKRAWR